MIRAHYQYTPYIWPMVAAAGTVAVLSAYAWRRRAIPGALPFAVMTALAVPWAVAAALELSASEIRAKVFWTQFEQLWQLPTVTAGIWFALDYTNLNRWLTRRTLTLLALPPVAYVLMAVTNDAHHLIWRGYAFDGDVHLLRAAGSWMFTDYGLVLGVVTGLLFVWLFLQSPLHRWPVALCLCGHVSTRAAYLLDLKNANPVPPLDPTMLAVAIAAVMYAAALFRFRLFDLVPVAYATVLEQMREAMLVMDGRHRIVDLNPAAERILGLPAGSARGRDLARAQPALAAATAPAAGQADAPREVRLGTAGGNRDFSVHLSPLVDRRGFARGTLVLLHDVTEQKLAQAQLLDNQRAVATLQERERVARELHDSLGQVLGYLKMQAQAVRGLLARERPAEADACLARLVAAAQDAHEDVRDYIAAARASGTNGSFLGSLENCLDGFRATSGIATKLETPPGLNGHPFEPTVEAQFLYILQEALTNVRKHAAAREVRVRIALLDGLAEATVHDDGVGFDVETPIASYGRSFGLRFMRERAAEIGGRVTMRSTPGQGTDIVIAVPLAKEAHAGIAG